MSFRVLNFGTVCVTQFLFWVGAASELTSESLASPLDMSWRARALHLRALGSEEPSHAPQHPVHKKHFFGKVVDGASQESAVSSSVGAVGDHGSNVFLPVASLLVASSQATITQDTSREHCLLTDTKFVPLGMSGVIETIEADTLLCQQRCAKTPRCASFTWWPSNGACSLQDSMSHAAGDPDGAISGPTICNAQAASTGLYFQYFTFLRTVRLDIFAFLVGLFLYAMLAAGFLFCNGATLVNTKS